MVGYCKVPGCSVRYKQHTIAIYSRSVRLPMATIVLSSPRMNLHRSMDSISPSETASFDRRHSTVTCSSFSTNSSSSPELTTDTTNESVVTPDSEDEGETSPRVPPKIEELDEEVDINSIDVLKEAKPHVTLPQPKKRGRPRKHPIVEQKKTSHARSKTGCTTCRRRKKKCDETRPICTNCEKNNVVCGGYEPKQEWRSGKQKSMLYGINNAVVPIQTLPPLIAGVEDMVDRTFFKYFACQVGTVLSLTDNHNPFLEIILPMAKEHIGLMHSLLYLSSSCLLASQGDRPQSEWENRSRDHHVKAVKCLMQEVATLEHPPSESSTALLLNGDPTIAQTLLMCLSTVCSGATDGLYRQHLNAMKELLTSPHYQFPNEQLRHFILEFLLYHDYSSAITNLKSPLDHRTSELMENFTNFRNFQNFQLPGYMIQPQAGTLLGVLDGLFGYISRIRRLRDQIRDYQEKGIYNWHSDLQDEAFSLDDEIRKWEPSFAPGTVRYTASLLYKQCTWLYLARTISASKAQPQFQQAVDFGLQYLRSLPWDSDDGSMQSILLMPLFLLGCAAFDPQQRPEIALAFERLQEWSKFGNISKARQIVEEVWQMMDQGREKETWDWETIIDSKGWDFLVT